MKKFASIPFALLLSIVLVSSVSAAWFSLHESSCSGYLVNNSACFKEDTGGGGDIIFLIQGANTYVDNLNAISTPSGTKCNGPFLNNGSWNDCIDWVTMNIASGYKLCAFYDANEGGGYYKKTGPFVGSVSFSGSNHDSFSSIVLVNSGSGYCP